MDGTYLVNHHEQKVVGSETASSRAWTASLSAEHRTLPTLAVGVGPEVTMVWLALTQSQTLDSAPGFKSLNGEDLEGSLSQKSQNLAGSVTSCCSFFTGFEDAEQSAAAKVAATRAEEK